MCIRKRAIQVVFKADALESWQVKRLRVTAEMPTSLAALLDFGKAFRFTCSGST
jgi:hypothetical protein